MYLSKNLTLQEVTKSNQAIRLKIDNIPTPEHLANLEIVAKRVFEPIRDYFGKPLYISSGYRSEALNKAVKGSKTSDHCKGLALDIDGDVYGGVSNAEIFEFIKNNLTFKQLIWEFGDDNNPAWIHVSYDEGNNKKEILKTKDGKKYVKI